MITRTEQKVAILYEQQKAIIQACLEANLTLLCDKTDKGLNKAHQWAQ